MAKKLYHYTTVENLEKILQCGEIKVSNKLHGKRLESPGVWLSTNHDWDFIYANGAVKNGRARIEIDRKILGDRVVTWERFKLAYGLSIEESENIERLAFYASANPRDWFIRYSPIYSKLWLSIEIYRSGKWVKHKKKDDSKRQKLNAYEIAKAEHLARERAQERLKPKQRYFYWA
jgi:hypothetical protein